MSTVPPPPYDPGFRISNWLGARPGFEDDVGVLFVCPYVQGYVRCAACERSWRPVWRVDWQPDGAILTIRGWWRCPRGCNERAAERHPERVKDAEANPPWRVPDELLEAARAGSSEGQASTVPASAARRRVRPLTEHQRGIAREVDGLRRSGVEWRAIADQYPPIGQRTLQRWHEKLLHEEPQA